MRSTKSLLSAVLAFVSAAVSNATVYYVSPSGSDTNNGTSQSTPWKTIDRVNQSAFQISPGDQILFQRGGTYRGEITWGTSGTVTAPVTYGAYGTGNAPIISGAKQITAWTLHSGNIYRAQVGLLVEQVYVGSARQTLARWPNTTWARNTLGSNGTMTSTSLTQATGYFNGARCILRSTASSIDTLRITNHVGTTLTFGSNPTNVNMGSSDWGFFIENKLNLLDAAGEWYYDNSTGYLYLWAPGGVNPSTLNVEASVYRGGVNCFWQRQYGVISGLTFQHQRYAGILNEGANRVTVTNCTIQDTYHGIRSYGTYNNYNTCTIQRTLATGALLIDENTTCENNVFTDIALVAGRGEPSWGYFGVRAIGTGNIVRGNRFTNIGYTAVEASHNQLVERNSISNYTALLNDGGGINFDNANGITIQDNVIQNPIGGLDGSATNYPHYQHLGVGIYFGNTSIQNATVQRNHLYNILGVGINVDHCMNSVGLRIKDNVIFNAGIGMSISDYSNNNGPSAVAPYYVANFNDEFSGNTIYSLGKDKLCMRFYNCYSPNWVDFGTFANNHYYSPYNELCIFIHNLNNTWQRYYSLEEWRSDRNEDLNSDRSPLRQTELSTTTELSSNLIVNGDFSANTTGWGGWPTNAQVTRATNYLDNGCLKAYLPDPSVSSTFAMRNPDWFSITNGQWYRMRLSIQSNAEGLLRVGLKAQTTLSDPYAIGERYIPFGTERRDLEIYFQSNLTDVAQLRFTNDHTEPTYYIDNVDVRRVSVQTVDAGTLHKFYVNDQATAQTYTVPTSGCWKDIAGNVLSAGQSFTLQPYTSRILYKLPDNQCTTQPTNASVGAKVFLMGPMDWTAYQMRDDLRSLGYLPLTEPYTNQGFILQNAGAAVPASTMAVTGSTAIVDWVLLELRNNDAGYSEVAQRACLVRRDGTIVGTDGSPVITFTGTITVGKHLAVLHRNHLGVMSANTIATDAQVIDFTLPSVAVYGTDALKSDGVRRALWSGDSNTSGVLAYTGAGNDRDPMLVAVGSSTPTSTVIGYRLEDANLDGTIKYTGVNNDRDVVLQNIGGSTPTNTKTAQLP